MVAGHLEGTMTTFVRLTNNNNEHIDVNLDHVLSIQGFRRGQPDAFTTITTVRDKQIHVKETPDEIYGLVKGTTKASAQKWNDDDDNGDGD